MDKLYADLQRGNAAKELLENELLQEVISKLRQDSFSAWENSPEPGVREQHWHSIRNLNRIIDRLNKIAADGRFASKQIEDANAREAAKARKERR